MTERRERRGNPKETKKFLKEVPPPLFLFSFACDLCVWWEEESPHLPVCLGADVGVDARAEVVVAVVVGVCMWVWMWVWVWMRMCACARVCVRLVF